MAETKRGVCVCLYVLQVMAWRLHDCIWQRLPSDSIMCGASYKLHFAFRQFDQLKFFCSNTLNWKRVFTSSTLNQQAIFNTLFSLNRNVHLI